MNKFTSRLERAGERVNELEDKLIEIIPSKYES